MRYSKYTIFLKVVELESFSKTADFYKYSQSAVTQIVKSLEAELQMTLLQTENSSSPIYGNWQWQKKECGKKPEKSQEWTGD